MISRRLAMEHAITVRRAFCKYIFVQQKSPKGWTVNASDDEFIQNGGGMCRDFVRQQTKFLRKKRDPSLEFESIIYAALDTEGQWDHTTPTHAFNIIYGRDGSIYLPESSLDCITGVWYFPSLRDCFSLIVAALEKPRENEVPMFYSYIGDDPNLIGMNRLATMSYIMAEGGGKQFQFEGDISPIYEASRISG